MKESPALRIALRPSRLLGGGLAVVHGATLAPLWLSGLPVWSSVLLASAVLGHGFWAIRRFALLRTPDSIVGVALEPEAGCRLESRDGTGYSGRVDPATVVLGPLVVLAVRTSGRTRRLALIAADMLAEEELRRLRVALRWGGLQESAGTHV